MLVPKLRSYNNLDMMKTGQKIVKSEEGNDSVDNFIKHAIGKESVLSFSRESENPIQWLQLLNALDQQDLSGWPLLYPKVQMQKCEKCTREFCSSINYRRHIRVHRRSLNIDKDSPKIRDFLGAFWDKLSVEEAKEIVSFKDVMLEEVSGPSIVRALTSVNRKPGYYSLPQVYVKAGVALLDLIQGRQSRFPISSKELFSILDDASEKTFLCPGTAISMQKFMFDGEPGKIGLEMKNLTACTSFLMEQNLVKEWIADKDAEALRCQKLLVEEEEAAQRRQTEILERKRLKKLRQKEQKAKEQDEEESGVKESSSDSLESSPSADDMSIAQPVSNSRSHIPESLSNIQPFVEPGHHLNTEEEIVNTNIHMASDTTISTSLKNFDHHQVQHGNGVRRPLVTRRPQPTSRRGEPNGFRTGLQVSKLGAIKKHENYKDHKATTLAYNHKIWSRKNKLENRGDLIVREQEEPKYKSGQDNNCELLIGSISVTLGDYSGSRNKVDSCPMDQPPPKQNNNIREKPLKPEACQTGVNRSMMKLWRPVGRPEAGSSITRPNDKEAEGDIFVTSMDERYVPREASDGCCALNTMDSSTVMEEADRGTNKLFSSQAAEAFLAQRWKEAIAADHVKLVLIPEIESPGSPVNQENAHVAVVPPPPPSSDCCNTNVLRSSENRLGGMNDIGRTNTGPKKSAKFRPKAERGYKLKYIPKQRNGIVEGK